MIYYNPISCNGENHMSNLTQKTEQKQKKTETKMEKHCTN